MKKREPEARQTVEKLAKEAKELVEAKMNEAEVKPIGGLVELLLSKIKSIPAAEERWKSLTARLESKTKEEVGEKQEQVAEIVTEIQEEVAEYLFRYCGGTQQQLKAGYTAACRFRDALQPAAVEIRRTADTTERILKDLRNIAGITPHDPDFDKLPSIQRAFADEVESLEPILKKTIGRGVRVEGEKDGPITGGRSEALSILVDLVSGVVDDPYAHLAPLVAAVKGDVDTDYDTIADDLRNAFNRYWKVRASKSKNPVTRPTIGKSGRKGR
jgi:hypothetical protein